MQNYTRRLPSVCTTMCLLICEPMLSRCAMPKQIEENVFSTAIHRRLINKNQKARKIREKCEKCNLPQKHFTYARRLRCVNISLDSPTLSVSFLLLLLFRFCPPLVASFIFRRISDEAKLLYCSLLSLELCDAITMAATIYNLVSLLFSWRDSLILYRIFSTHWQNWLKTTNGLSAFCLL